MIYTRVAKEGNAIFFMDEEGQEVSIQLWVDCDMWISECPELGYITAEGRTEDEAVWNLLLLVSGSLRLEQPQSDEEEC